MNKLIRFFLVAGTCLIGMAGLSSRAADNIPVNAIVKRYTLPAGESLNQVQEGIVAGLTTRHWTIGTVTETKVIAIIHHHGIDATATFTFDEKQILMVMMGREDDDTSPSVIPTRWLNAIMVEFNKRLGAAEARTSPNQP